MNNIILYLFYYIGIVHCIYYDTYTGNIISEAQVKIHDKLNNTFWCVGEYEPCDPNEGRRVDGTCNNLQYPTRGASHTPFIRLLEAVYDKNFEPKKALSGNPLPLPRRVRTDLINMGKMSSQRFTQLAIYNLVFLTPDVTSFNDIAKYVIWKPYCCTEKGKKDKDCAPNKVPDDDPVHRFTNIRCLNMTRPESFQSVGCVEEGTVPERIVSSTSLFDLSILYGNTQKALDTKGRLFRGGFLKYEIENGRMWPPSTRTQANLCLLNDKVKETKCHATPEDTTNTLLGINLLNVWYWRHHNYIAHRLSEINPCWDDETLFFTARDINIAMAMQILYYELFPLFMGRENLIRDQVISPSKGFSDVYDPEVLPQVSLEFPFVMRWLHTVQEGSVNLYDSEGCFLKQLRMVNLTLKTGLLHVDNNMEGITEGAFRQASANIDYLADPDVVEIGLGPLQRAIDLMTNDLAKNRYFGFQPYVKYYEYCFQKTITTWSDLEGIIDPERIEILQNLYEDVADVDLLAGVWVEKIMRGGYVPPTFYCLVTDQLVRNKVADRFWYESSERPDAFTLEQLLEIRKATIAGLLCTVGDKITKIQPQAFLRIDVSNKITKCDNIPRIDLSAWKDQTCEYQEYDCQKFQ